MLPALRDELSLHPGPAALDGSPTWTLRDPVRNRFFRIDWPAFEILCRWHLRLPEAVARAVAAETTLHPDPEDITAIADFLAANQLVATRSPEDTARLAKRAAAEDASWWTWLLHHYLFFRVPLVRPDRFLSETLGLVAWLGGRWFRTATLAALVLGLILAGRQWQTFLATFLDTASMKGFLGYLVALGAVKAAHELAHAYVAKQYGCRVPTMGVAFLVTWPVLYTDVNETWKLQKRRQRLAVGAAGIAAELAIAAWATLAWSFLPDGGLRQAVFVVAAVTWISSLAINLSPFMRFDGYFLLMDGLEMPNLHPRAFAMGRWWLREVLFGLGEPPPEPQSAGRRRALVAFAFLVWAYRLVLFLGIALLVYHFFFKALGVFLFAVEIAWFVALPLLREMGEWKKRGQAIRQAPRTRWTLAALAGSLALLLVPWRSQVEAPAVLKAPEVTELYLPFAARLVESRAVEGRRVGAGEMLFRFASPDLDHRRAQAAARLESRRAELEAATLEATYRDRLGVIREEIAKAEAELRAIAAEEARLTLTASVTGTLRDPADGLEPGSWISPKTRLALVRPDGAPVIDAYLAEEDLDRISLGAAARFFADAGDRSPVAGRVVAIERTPVKLLADPILAVPQGGTLPARKDVQGVVPEGSLFRLRIALDGEAPPAQQLRGIAVLDGDRQSLLVRLARAALIVLVREWGA